jgi:hypothetical protein
VRLNDEGKGQIDGSKVVREVVHGGSDGKLCRPPMASPEPGRMIAFPPFQGFIRGMSVDRTGWCRMTAERASSHKSPAAVLGGRQTPLPAGQWKQNGRGNSRGNSRSATRRMELDQAVSGSLCFPLFRQLTSDSFRGRPENPMKLGLLAFLASNPEVSGGSYPKFGVAFRMSSSRCRGRLWPRPAVDLRRC